MKYFKFVEGKSEDKGKQMVEGEDFQVNIRDNPNPTHRSVKLGDPNRKPEPIKPRDEFAENMKISNLKARYLNNLKRKTNEALNHKKGKGE